MGASFCHVNTSRPDMRDTPWITSGIQKWKGASPNFIRSARVIRHVHVWLEKELRVHRPEYV